MHLTSTMRNKRMLSPVRCVVGSMCITVEFYINRSSASFVILMGSTNARFQAQTLPSQTQTHQTLGTSRNERKGETESFHSSHYYNNTHSKTPTHTMFPCAQMHAHTPVCSALPIKTRTHMQAIKAILVLPVSSELLHGCSIASSAEEPECS